MERWGIIIPTESMPKPPVDVDIFCHFPTLFAFFARYFDKPSLPNLCTLRWGMFYGPPQRSFRGEGKSMHVSIFIGFFGFTFTCAQEGITFENTAV